MKTIKHIITMIHEEESEKQPRLRDNKMVPQINCEPENLRTPSQHSGIGKKNGLATLSDLKGKGSNCTPVQP